MNFQVVTVKPPRYPHSECFIEIADTLVFGLRRLGHHASFSWNQILPSAKNILLGAHLLGHTQTQYVPDGSILYNLEQLAGAKLGDHYFELAKRCQVWDYSELNKPEWEKRGIHCKVVPIGYVPELTRVEPNHVQDIDVLFYGSVNERRRVIIDALERCGLKVAHFFGLYGNTRDRFVSRAKVVLNLHYYESKVFEIVRVSYLMANRTAVVTEDSIDIPEYLRPGLAVAPYAGLVKTCCEIVESPSRIHELRQAAFWTFSTLKEEEVLGRALA